MSGLTFTTRPLASPARAVTVNANRRTTIIDAATVAFACLTFFGICVYQLNLPGLYPDEAFDVIPTMQLLLGHPVELQRGVGIHIFGTALPLMSSSDYQGVTSTYLALPFFALGGINVISLRLMTVLVGVLAILLAFFLARSWVGTVPARLVVLLLATSPAWIFWSRIGVYVVSEVVPITEGALLAFTIWAKRRPLAERNGPLYLAAFLLGLGLATKLLYLWILVAVAACAFVLWASPIWETRRSWFGGLRRWIRITIISGIAFCVGAFPFLLYNMLTRGATIQVMRANLGTTAQGVNNQAVLRNLWTEVDAFRVVLDGAYFWFQGVGGRVYANPLTPAIFAISAAGLIALSLLAKGKFRVGITGLPAIGMALTGGALAIALLLASSLLSGALFSIGMMLTVALGTVGIVLLAMAGIRADANVAPAGWALLIVTAIAGAVWWFGGAGRPEGPAPGAFLGLWPVDGAGILFWLSVAGLLLLLGFDKRPAPLQRPTVAMLSIIAVVIAQSAVTVSGLWPTHLVVLLPLPQMLIASFAIALGRRMASLVARARLPWPNIRVAIGALVATLVVGSLLVLDLGVDYSYHRDLGISGGGTTFSDAIYRLANYLQGQPASEKIVAMDWGFKRPLQFLTLEQVNPIEAYGYSDTPTPEFYTGLRPLLQDPNTLYLFHTREITAYQRYDAFVAEAQKEGKQVQLVKRFYHRDGWPIYEIYTAK